MDSRDGVLATISVLSSALDVLSRSMEVFVELALKAGLWFDACLNSVDRSGLSRVGLTVMVARDLGAFFAKPLGSSFSARLEGERVGLGRGSREK